jgi:hypothetical protein
LLGIEQPDRAAMSGQHGAPDGEAHSGSAAIAPCREELSNIWPRLLGETPSPSSANVIRGKSPSGWADISSHALP